MRVAQGLGDSSLQLIKSSQTADLLMTVPAVQYAFIGAARAALS
ncbi:hypothetical protein [Variovorax sp. RA8]|nr:hypothetical protein [Variovorax sp. RA8]